MTAASVPRTATTRDAPEIARLLTILGHPTQADRITARWREWSDDGNVALVVDAAGGRLAGVATLHRMTVLHRPKPVGRITALVVDPGMRAQGIGRTLVRAAEEIFTDAGCGLLEITTNLRLSEAHTFYERLGYERTSLRFAKVLAEHGS